MAPKFASSANLQGCSKPGPDRDFGQNGTGREIPDQQNQPGPDRTGKSGPAKPTQTGPDRKIRTGKKQRTGPDRTGEYHDRTGPDRTGRPHRTGPDRTGKTKPKILGLSGNRVQGAPFEARTIAL